MNTPYNILLLKQINASALFISLQYVLFVVLLLLFDIAHAQPKHQAVFKEDAPRNITILADQSLSVPLTLIAREYSREFHAPVSVLFGSTEQQIKKVREGMDADVLIAAKPLWIKRLKQQGLMDIYSQVSIARNRLVLVGSHAAPKGAAPNAKTDGKLSAQKDISIASFLPANGKEFQFGLGNPQFLAEGSYGFEVLTKSRLLGVLEPHLVLYRSIYLLHRSIAEYNTYGIVFYTDALLHPDLPFLTSISPELHKPIQYQGVAIVGDNMEQSRHFLKYMQEEKAISVFQRFGFSTNVADELVE